MTSQRINKLNVVKNVIINFANENNIDLQAEFGTTETFKYWVMGLCFKTLVDGGVATSEAFDAVFGDGRYDELVENVWNAAQVA